MATLTQGVASAKATTQDVPDLGRLYRSCTCDSSQTRRDKKHLHSSWVQVRIPKAQQVRFNGWIWWFRRTSLIDPKIPTLGTSFYTLSRKLTELKGLTPLCFPSGPTSTRAPQGHRRHRRALAEGEGRPPASPARTRSAKPGLRAPSATCPRGWGRASAQGATLTPAGRAGGGRDPGPLTPARGLAPIPNRNGAGLPLHLTLLLLPPQVPETGRPPPRPSQPRHPAPLRPAAHRGFPHPLLPRAASRGCLLHMRTPPPCPAFPGARTHAP